MFTTSIDCFSGLSVPLVTGHSNYSGFGIAALYWLKRVDSFFQVQILFLIPDITNR